MYHGREGRPNLVIKHEEGRYSAYCHSCHEGGIKDKEHVRFTGKPAPKESCSLRLPDDKVALHALTQQHQDAVLAVLASKNMDNVYMPALWYSDSRKRILVHTAEGWLGRDVTGNSPQKWLTYNRQLFLAHRPTVQTLAVVVEDAFSFFKVKWAMRDAPNVGVYCALGTVLCGTLLLELTKYSGSLMFFDGDSAGWRGASESAARVRTFGAHSTVGCAPVGLDPKDMTIQAIREHVWSGTNRTKTVT